MARADILDALEWYGLRRDEIAENFAAELDGIIERMGTNPMQFPALHSGLRRAVLRRFPYGLVFRVLPDLVQIIACLHTSRDPRRWEMRV